jgi:hypothetical protein
MTTLTLLFVLVVLLLLTALAIAIAAILRRGDVPMRTLFLGAVLVGLAVIIWTSFIQHPLALP